MSVPNQLLDFDYASGQEKPFVALYKDYVWSLGDRVYLAPYMIISWPEEGKATFYKRARDANDAHVKWLDATGGRASEALRGAK